MPSSSLQRRAKRGSVQVKNSRNWLQLVFTYSGQRHYISLGLRSTPLNRKIAQDKAFEVQRDIEYGEFDSTYQKYQEKAAVKTEKPEPKSSAREISLPDLWKQYVDVRKAGKSPATVRMYGWVANHLSRCPYEGVEDAQAICDWLGSNVPANSTKRLLMHLSACCKWAQRSKLIEINPFEGRSAEIKLKKAGNEETEIFPFTRGERDRIIQSFANNRYYRHYTSLVKFLFFTGCRPSEALALTWQNVSESTIVFDQALIYDGQSSVLKEGLKTQKARRLPINSQLRDLIENLGQVRKGPSELVFPSPRGKFINWGNFTNRAWKVVLNSLSDISYRNPYQTRHTFCSLCREVDIPSIRIAKWVGTSAAMIDRVYAKPTDYVQVPEL